MAAVAMFPCFLYGGFTIWIKVSIPRVNKVSDFPDADPQKNTFWILNFVARTSSICQNDGNGKHPVLINHCASESKKVPSQCWRNLMLPLFLKIKF